MIYLQQFIDGSANIDDSDNIDGANKLCSVCLPDIVSLWATSTSVQFARKLSMHGAVIMKKSPVQQI